MPVVRSQQHSPYTPRQLYDLVADIERYPQFLPWCRAARILERKPDELLAELVICFKGMTERYTSRVALTPPAEPGDARIDVTMTHGPFEHLHNHWHFVPAPQGGTQIAFFLDFQFRSRLLDKLMGGLFSRANAKLTEAFRQRAESLYGPNCAPNTPLT